MCCVWLKAPIQNSIKIKRGVYTLHYTLKNIKT